MMRMLILVKRKVVNKGFPENEKLDKLLKSQRRYFYDLMKNPTQTEASTFFKFRLIRFLWARYVGTGALDAKMVKFKPEERQVIHHTFEFFTQ